MNLFTLYKKKDFKAAYAHIKDNSAETLEEHSKRSLIVGKYFIEDEDILSGLDKNSPFFNIFKKGLEFSIFFHDYGKLNINFQLQKMNNLSYSEVKYFQNKEFSKAQDSKNKEKIEDSSNHSRFNNIDDLELYLEKDFNQLNISSNKRLIKIKKEILNIFKILVEKHHSGLDIDVSRLIETEELRKFLPDFSFTMELFHSILINSDVIATKYYMESDTDILTIEEYIKIHLSKNTNLKNNLKSLEEIMPYNKEVYSSNKNKELNECKTLNELKTYTAKYIKENIEFNDISFLKGSVGIGKTNLSLILANEYIKKENIKKFIYVAPLNNLLYQVSKEIQETTSFREEDISIINYINRKENKLTNLEDSYYYENFNKDLILTSSVNFFEKLFHKGKKDIAHLVFLKDSFIIIDEIQLVNDKFFNIIYKYISYLVKYLNCKVVFISATIPIPKYTIDNLFNGSIPYVVDKNKLDEINDSFLLKRNNYNLDYFDENENSKAIKYLIEKKSNSILIVHNSISKLQKYYQLISEDIPSDYQIFFYNNNILKPILENILKRVKLGEKIIVFATKKIETGVDISFENGIKFIDAFDNIQQFGGRINRYMSFNDSEILILKDPDIYFSKQKREAVLKKYSTNKKIVEEYIENIEGYYTQIFNDTEIGNYGFLLNRNDHIELNKLKLIEEYTKVNFIVEVDFNDNDFLDLLNNDFKEYILDKEITSSKELFYRKDLIFDNISFIYQEYFKISGFINKKTEFAKNELGKLEELNISKTKKYIDIYKVLNKDNFYYDLKLGIVFNKDIDEVLDTFNV